MINLEKLIIPLILTGVYYLFQKPKKIKPEYFKNKHILITGASSGIGLKISEILRDYDCKLYLLARSFNNSKFLNVNYFKCDCSNYDQVNQIIKGIDNKIDIVIHAAGAGDWKFLDEMNIEEVNQCLQAPLQASLNVTHCLLPQFRENNNGQMVFIQSPVIKQPWSSCTAYSVSRWGMKGLAESLRADLFKTNITVSEIVLAKTNSNYFRTNQTALQRFPKIGYLIGEITPREAAFATIWMIQNRKEYYYYPHMMRIVTYLQYLFPGIVKYLTLVTSFYSSTVVSSSSTSDESPPSTAKESPSTFN